MKRTETDWEKVMVDPEKVSDIDGRKCRYLDDFSFLSIELKFVRQHSVSRGFTEFW